MLRLLILMLGSRRDMLGFVGRYSTVYPRCNMCEFLYVVFGDLGC